METKSLLIGISSFIAGGLLVSVAATTFDKKDSALSNTSSSSSMTSMVSGLQGKSGDEFDRQFLLSMTEHHQGAVDMAKLAQSHAKHQEVKALATNIITAQEKELAEMKQWQMDWGYQSSSATPKTDHSSMQMSH